MMRLFKTDILYILFAIIIFQVGCTPKTTQPIVESSKTSARDTIVQSDCRTFDELGKLKQEALEAFVIYRDFLKAGDYEQSYSYWKRAYELAPGSDGKKTYHFSDGIKLYSYFYNEAPENEKKMWVDSVQLLYDRRAKCFGDDDYLAASHAFDLYYNFKEHVDEDIIWNLFVQALEKKKEKADYFIINPMAKLLYDRTINNTITLEESRKYATLLNSAIKYGSNNCEDLCEAWEIIKSYAPDRLEALEAVDGLYNCTYYKDKYYPIYLSNKENCEVIEQARARLIRGNCDLNTGELKEMTQQYNAICRKEKVTGVLSEAKALYLNGQYSSSIEKYEQYLSSSDNNEKNASINLFISKIYYRDLKNFPQSRKYALRAVKLKPNWGDPYMLIGKLYASSGPICGPGTGWKSQIVTWPAIDKWEYAKKIDPKVATEANRLISQYEKYMPSKEDIFYRPSVKEGASFKVECWINETTKVRAARG